MNYIGDNAGQSGACVINAQTIWEAYESLLDLFGRLDKVSEPALIRIGDVEHHGMPMSIDGPHREYYSAFVSGDIDTRWSVRPDWYLSYSRRLCRPIGGSSALDLVVEELVRNPSSRRAVISTNEGSSDRLSRVPALTSVMLRIEDLWLSMHTVWRSRDLVRALPMGMLAMQSYMRIVYRRLLNYMPGLQLGYYLEFISSLHVPSSEDPRLLESRSFVPACNACDAETLRHIWSIVLTGKEEEYDRIYDKLAMPGVRKLC